MIKAALKYLVIPYVVITLCLAYFPKMYQLKLPPGINNRDLAHIVKVLNELKQYDTLYLSLDSNGGSMDELERFLNARRTTKGRLICTIEYGAASAAAIASQACDHVYIKPKAYILFHMPRTMQLEKEGSEEHYKVHVITKHTKNVFEFMYYLYFVSMLKYYGVDQVLTSNEYNRLLEGEDITLSGEEYAKRSNKVEALE